MRRILLVLPFLLASCGEAIEDNHFANDMELARPENAPVTPPAPVKIGELGSNFPACNGIGTTRNLQAGQQLPLRAAPFENAEQIGSVPASSRFFICSRSIDQKWLGIVFGDNGAEEACEVSAPVARRTDYSGPCRSGWVASPFVKWISGIDSPGRNPASSSGS